MKVSRTPKLGPTWRCYRAYCKTCTRPCVASREGLEPLSNHSCSTKVFHSCTFTLPQSTCTLGSQAVRGLKSTELHIQQSHGWLLACLWFPGWVLACDDTRPRISIHTISAWERAYAPALLTHLGCLSWTGVCGVDKGQKALI